MLHSFVKLLHFCISLRLIFILDGYFFHFHGKVLSLHKIICTRQIKDKVLLQQLDFSAEILTVLTIYETIL